MSTVVYSRGRVRRALLDSLLVLALAVPLWAVVAAVVGPVFWASFPPAGLLTTQVYRYWRWPWLARTSAEGLDLYFRVPVRLPWAAIGEIRVAGRSLAVTVHDPTAPRFVVGRHNPSKVWRTTTFEVHTPEIDALVRDLRERLPHLATAGA